MIRTALSTLLSLTLLAATANALAVDRELDSPADITVSTSDDDGNRAQGLIDRGMELLGVRYRFGGTSPETGLDCSGLVRNVFRNAVGLDLPRRASDMARLGEKVGRSDLQPGDLVFFNTMRRDYSHVGLYMGEGRFLHAPSSGGVVRVENMNLAYWTSRFNGARRLLAENNS
jgi:cell wall-associated NlpC family hydrolase